jgi:NAD(P)-dependent dehydrogenase (short-subunit alcohol dehydrogenase family)
MQLSSAEKNDSAGLLAGKVVVVTGGAGLLGQAFCRSIAEHGGLPVIADIDAERGEKALDVFHNLME